LGVVLYVMLCGRYPFDGQNAASNIHRAYFEYPRHVDLSDEVKNLIESLVERIPKRRLSIQNCLRCKWSKFSIMHMKCVFYRPKIKDWKRRRIILPIRYDAAT